MCCVIFKDRVLRILPARLSRFVLRLCVCQCVSVSVCACLCLSGHGHVHVQPTMILKVGLRKSINVREGQIMVEPRDDTDVQVVCYTRV